MRILVLGFFRECEYIASMCTTLRARGDVIFIPAFRLVHADKRRDAYYQLYRLILDADLVFWQCLHALHMHEVAQIIKRTNGKNILVSLDDDRPLASFDAEHILRTQLMDLVLTASVTNAAYLGHKGVLLDPPIFWGEAQTLGAASDVPILFTLSPEKNLAPALLAADGNLFFQTSPTAVAGGVFINIHQPRVGGPTQGMLQCLLLGLPVASPTTPDLEAFFTPGKDFILLDAEFSARVASHCPPRAVRVATTFDQLLTLDTEKKQRPLHPFIPNRAPLLFEDDHEEETVKAGFDQTTYQVIHHLKLDAQTEDAWKHYCLIGYPIGLFYCAHRQRATSGELLGPGNVALLRSALLSPSPFAFLMEALRLEVDPLPVIKLLVQHGAGENPNRRRCRALSGSLAT